MEIWPYPEELTEEMLIKMRLDRDERDLLNRLFPEGMKITEENILTALNGFMYLFKILRRILKSKDFDLLLKETAPAGETKRKADAVAQNAYDEVLNAPVKSKEATNEAAIARGEAFEAARVAYNETVAPVIMETIKPTTQASA